MSVDRDGSLAVREPRPRLRRRWLLAAVGLTAFAVIVGYLVRSVREAQRAIQASTTL